MVHHITYHIYGKMYNSACVQSVTYETETWASEAENLHSMESRTYDGEADV